MSPVPKLGVAPALLRESGCGPTACGRFHPHAGGWDEAPHPARSRRTRCSTGPGPGWARPRRGRRSPTRLPRCGKLRRAEAGAMLQAGQYDAAAEMAARIAKATGNPVWRQRAVLLLVDLAAAEGAVAAAQLRCRFGGTCRILTRWQHSDHSGLEIAHEWISDRGAAWHAINWPRVLRLRDRS